MPRFYWYVCNVWSFWGTNKGFWGHCISVYNISIVFHSSCNTHLGIFRMFCVGWFNHPIFHEFVTCDPPMAYGLYGSQAAHSSCSRGCILRKCFRGVLPQLLPHHPHQWTMLRVASPVCHRSLCLSATRQQGYGSELLFKGSGSRMKNSSFPVVSPKHVVRIYASDQYLNELKQDWSPFEQFQISPLIDDYLLGAPWEASLHCRDKIIYICINIKYCIYSRLQ